MRRSVAPAVACLVVLAALTAIPVAGHGNHVTTDAQVVDDHVVVERSFVLADGYAVVHLDQAGQMGRVLGHVELSAGPDENYEIPVDEEFLSQVDGAATVWVTLHRSDGDGEFEPNQDTPLTGLQNQPAGVTVPIRVSDDGNVNVAAKDFSSQRIDSPSVTVRRVESNASGFVAVESGNGTVVGTAPVEAGVTENVSVPLSASFYEGLAENESASLTATMYRDDGDGEFQADADEVVRAGGTPVASEFGVTKVRNASRTTSVVVTATGTTVPRTTTAATGGGESSGSEPGTDAASGSTDGSGASGGSGELPGFGVVAVLFAALAAVVAVRIR
ncbi:hypothetical protein G9C85_05355 [Halorubellus sp. JP-L1]|uniref:DUF7282 domain-containing protein n=1 Tax=Halorubellus sp. JP-L1 TaxID=2715753 RepID=UPI00140A9329|nr:hypothetical protein [Halorubellus sp. JP-L1]NHN41063.1 hypothetical protein [Halorubellus sp. JP-L1]